MDKKVVKTSEIRIQIGLNADKMPVSLSWETEGQEGGKAQDSKALLLSFFDRQSKDTLKIDLWTVDMQVAEMDRFFFQTLRSLADTYFRATQNKELAADMQRFVQYFGEKTEIIPK
ncbi:MAG: gliding motility protein GldC [Saprospiraceae bacterium]|nr:gliding motility protein GldC [Saprospiraceae bacterium]MCB0675482.1 gliding motility protein GldC [Saprospiraceae bacterium]MCB0681066.1 gliding motility protein GldC [Saprospiraceae bacterium]